MRPAPFSGVGRDWFFNIPRTDAGANSGGRDHGRIAPPAPPPPPPPPPPPRLHSWHYPSRARSTRSVRSQRTNAQ